MKRHKADGHRSYKEAWEVPPINWTRSVTHQVNLGTSATGTVRDGSAMGSLAAALWARANALALCPIVALARTRATSHAMVRRSLSLMTARADRQIVSQGVVEGHLIH